MRLEWVFVMLLAVVVATAGVPGPVAGQQAQAGLGIGASGLVAGRDFVEGQVVVGLRRWPQGGQSLAPRAAGSGEVVKDIPGTAILLQYASEAEAHKAIRALLADPNVSFVERNGFASIPPLPPLLKKNGVSPRLSDPLNLAPGEGSGSASGEPVPELVSADPGTGHQWHHTVIRKSASLGTLVSAPPTVAVIDTGVDYTHSDLAGKVFLGKNCAYGTSDPMDDHGNGTHVAGTIGAFAANGRHGEGVSHNSRILAIKVSSSIGGTTNFDLACGLNDGRTRVTVPAVRVGHLSFTGGAAAVIATEIAAWKAAGKLLVVAAGNGNSNGTGTFNVDPNIGLRVMATEENDCRTSFSNFSPTATPALFNIAAPGFEIPSIFLDEGFRPLSGTQMASSVAAGAAALVWGQVPSLTLVQLISRLVNNGKAISCGFAASTRRVDVRRALFQNAETVVIGRVLDSNTGKPVSPGTVPATIQVRLGTAVQGTDLTNRGGSYEIVAPAGVSRSLVGIKAGYTTDTLRSPLTIIAGIPTGPFTDAMMKSRLAGNYQASLDWRTTQPNNTAAGLTTRGWDLDLGVRLPSLTVLNVGPAGDVQVSPFVYLPRDSFSDFEPVESLLIGPSAANGVYRIAVRRFNGPTGVNLPSSGAQVRLLNGPVGAAFLNAPNCTPALPVWHVANVTKAGTAYTTAVVNACLAAFP